MTADTRPCWYTDPPHGSGIYWALDASDWNTVAIHIRARNLSPSEMREIEYDNQDAMWEYYWPPDEEWHSLEFADDYIVAWCHTPIAPPPVVPGDARNIRPSFVARLASRNIPATTTDKE